jgi:hypothetical protein
MIWLIALGVILWGGIGAGSFIYWWTTDWDLTTNEIPLIFISLLIGPLAWPIGRDIHGDNRKPHTFVNRRDKDAG